MDLKLIEILPHLMRPAGEGIPTFSAGASNAGKISESLYSILFPEEAVKNMDVPKFWRKTWDLVPKARTVVIGVPTDTGAGIRRGAAYGPRGIRQELYKISEFVSLLKKSSVIDLGDIYVNPHLLHDSMLSEEQKRLCQESMYPEASSAVRAVLPVSVLSQLKLILKTLYKFAPNVRIQLIGGDHSIAWPVSEVLSKKFGKTFGIVQPDAHTDLLASRLGVKYCFGTWSYHANELLGRDGRLVQVGVRQSGRDRGHWESTLSVKQYWAKLIRERDESEVIGDLIQHLRSRGVKDLYFSNDIDGTDENEAPATGTPAPEGISSKFLFKLIAELKKNFNIAAADVVEVAPDLASPELSQKTCELAAKYLVACL